MGEALLAAIAQQEARRAAKPAAEAVAETVAATIAAETVAGVPAQVTDYLRAHPAPRGFRGEQGTAGTTGEPGLVWQGDWRASSTYAPGDCVAFEGSSYVAIEASTNVPPPAARWDLLAKKGDDGRDGRSLGPIVLGNAGTGSGSGLPAGGTVGQVVTNTAPGAGDWDYVRRVTDHDAASASDPEVSVNVLGNGNGGAATMQAGEGAGGFAGGSASLYGGAGGSAGGAEGSSISFGGGQANGAGGEVFAESGDAESGSNAQGGDVWLVPGAGDGAGRDGQLIAPLPTADPSVANALWSDSGTVVVSGSTAGAGSPAVDPGNIADPTTVTYEDIALKLNALMAAMRTAGSLA